MCQCHPCRWGMSVCAKGTQMLVSLSHSLSNSNIIFIFFLLHLSLTMFVFALQSLGAPTCKCAITAHRWVQKSSSHGSDFEDAQVSPDASFPNDHIWTYILWETFKMLVLWFGLWLGEQLKLWSLYVQLLCKNWCLLTFPYCPFLAHGMEL